MQFNERLKELRLKKGISQAELAKAIFVSRSAVAKWENGLGLPSETSLNLLAEYFSIGKEEFFTDKQTETVIVSKNITIAKSRKIIIAVCSIGLAIIIALTLTLIVIPKADRAQRFFVKNSDYQYTYRLFGFNQELAETIKVAPENIFLKNGGEIRADENGKILSVNIDAFCCDSDRLFSIQIQKSTENKYLLLKEPLKDVSGERVMTETLFNAISLYEFENCNYCVIFIISTDKVVNPLWSDISNQYLYNENRLVTVNENLIGLYARIAVLIDNRLNSEIYIKIKG